MKILRVIATMNPASGGPPQGLRNLGPALSKLGVENTVICFDPITSSYLKADGLTIVPLGAGKGPWRYNSTLRIWLSKNLSEFDAVVVHGLWLYLGYCVRKAVVSLRNKGQSPKFYIYPHGMLDPWFQKTSSRKLKALRNSFYWACIERKNVNIADALLFTSHEEMLAARESFSGYQANEAVVGYGLPSPPELDFANVNSSRSEHPYFLFLSRIDPKKGVDLLLRAYAKLLDQTDSDVPDLVIAGPDQCPYAKEMKILAESLGVQSRVRWAGMLTGKTKWKAIGNAFAFILPSHQENFGISVVEALSFGIPVLISDKVNIWKDIQNDEAGIVANDTEEGTYALLKIASDWSDDQRIAFGAAAKLCYQHKFSVETAAENLFKFINHESDGRPK